MKKTGEEWAGSVAQHRAAVSGEVFKKKFYSLLEHTRFHPILTRCMGGKCNISVPWNQEFTPSTF